MELRALIFDGVAAVGPASGRNALRLCLFTGCFTYAVCGVIVSAKDVVWFDVDLVFTLACLCIYVEFSVNVIVFAKGGVRLPDLCLLSVWCSACAVAGACPVAGCVVSRCSRCGVGCVGAGSRQIGGVDTTGVAIRSMSISGERVM